MKSRVTSHAIALYAHDSDAKNALFTYGFGLRCIDAITDMSKIPCKNLSGYELFELDPNDKLLLLPLKNMLIDHLGEAPTFMYYPPMTAEDLEKTHNRRKSRYFCAKQNDTIVAFLEICSGGENFICDDPHMQNICGTFCLKEHRGQNLYQNLLNFTIETLKNENNTLLGVDFESFNPTANSFWLKYFMPYTNSVVRRVDDNILFHKNI